MSIHGQAPLAANGSGVDNRRPDLLFVESELEQPGDEVDWSSWQPPVEPGPALVVTAVLVAHDGAAFLPRTLDALEAQTRRPDRLIAVDAGSADGSADMLGIATPHLVTVTARTGFGEAVRAALRSVPQNDSATGASGEPQEWLWLLHDDSAPAPDALQRLIETTDSGPSIGVAGCKQVSWNDSRRLLDVGFTTSVLGARVTGVDVDDFDQGQLDHRSDVLAVATPGMLVRRDLWERLGGPDPALADARIDLDLCRRAHLLGERVVVVPQAVMAHAEASSSGLRGRAVRRPSAWAMRDRRAAVHLRLASVPLPLLPLLLVWLGAAAVMRALVRLSLRQPDRAGAEIAAYLLAAGRPNAWIRARWRARRGRQMSRREYRRLLASRRSTLRQRRDRLSSYLRAQEEAWAAPEPGSAAATRSPAGRATSTVTSGAGTVARSGKGGSGWSVRRPRTSELAGPEDDALVVDVREPAGPDAPTVPMPTLPDDEIRFDDERERPRRPASLRIGLSIALLTGVVGLVALRVLLRGTGTPVGDALIPAPGTAAKLWSLGLSGWRPTGLGLAAVADPFDLVLAVLSGPFAGSTRVAAEFLLLAALPLASLVAWWAAAAVTRSRALRAWAALIWAAAPSLILAVTAGRLAAIVAHLMLPLTALALTRAVGMRPADPGAPGRRRASLAAASGAGLALTVLIASAPALAAPSLFAVLLLALVARHGRRLLVWTVAVPSVLLLPWWLAVAGDPRLLLAEPGGASAVAPGSPGWAAALWPADPAVINHGPVHRLARLVADLTGVADAGVWLRVLAVAVVVPPLLLGVAALTGRLRRKIAVVAWLVGLAALATAVAIPVVDIRPSAEGLLHGWSGPAVSLLLLAVVVASLSHLDGAAGRLKARSIGVRHWGAVAMGALAVVTPLLVLGAWAADGWTGTTNRWVHRADPEVLPAVAAAEANGAAATRTLTIQPTDAGVRWALYRTGGPQTGQESAASLTPSSLAARSAADQPVLDTIGALLSGGGNDERSSFADLDIGSVLLLTSRPADPDAADAAVASLDVAPGLVRVSNSAGKVLWRVELAASASEGDPTQDAPEESADPAEESVASEGGVPTRPARVRILGADGALVTTVPAPGVGFTADVAAGGTGRTLVLSERADAGWSASLDGSALTPAVHEGWAQAFELPAAGGTLVVRHADANAQAIGLGRLGVLGLALLAAIPLPRRRPRLLPPPKSWRSQEPAAVPVGTSGRRVRRPGDAPDRPRRPENGSRSEGLGTQEPRRAYAQHQSRMTELARRLAIEAADGDDPMAERPSRRRRRAARQAAEAMAAETRPTPGRRKAGGAAVKPLERSRPSREPEVALPAERPEKAQVAEKAQMAEKVAEKVERAEQIEKVEPAEQAPDTAGTEPVVLTPPPAEGEPARDAAPVVHHAPDAPKTRDLRPLRADSARNRPPGPRTSRENQAENPVTETPVEPGDSRPAEKAPNPAGIGDSDTGDPPSGDTASPSEARETAGASDRGSDRERGQDTGQDAPDGSGEEESS
ncbi:glycosyltransferase [Kineosporia succinea]|uniref:GT2 family glycosyltransferase n=1 Tax=Kineosporia succinea TaxID=84632 RepID=A0ABT9NYM7_9ACTN|nr:glycosyltransferase [Kineosporia succinea]MDP9825406.1 GT2 family glycosyltransferase [Kineosporia succinea]